MTEFSPHSSVGGDNDNVSLQDIASVSEVVGFPAERISMGFVKDYIMPSLIDTFSDGEISIPHPNVQDPALSEYFGTDRFAEGVYGERVRALFESGEESTAYQAERLIRFSAKFLAHQVTTGAVQLPAQKNVDIITQPYPTPEELLQEAVFGQQIARDTAKPAIIFDRQMAELKTSPRIIVDYGPGLQGRHHIDRQFADLQQRRMLYQYIAVGKGPFINTFLQEYWARRLNNQQVLDAIIGSAYVGREDGIAAASSDIIAAQKRHNDTTEIVDLVVASGVDSAGQDELSVGIANAHTMLKPEGTLLIRAAKSARASQPGSVPADEMVDMALQAGFSSSKAQFFNVTTGQNLTGDVRSLSVVFRK